jgi:hypothetical protein
VRPAANTAALMLYIALNLMTMARRPDLLSPYEATAEATYDELAQATGLSRTLIAAGLDRLKIWGFAVATGSDQKRKYQIAYGNDKYIRVPCRTIVDGNSTIRPFQSFRLRSKVELHALKIYLYLASIRGNLTGYSMVGSSAPDRAVRADRAHRADEAGGHRPARGLPLPGRVLCRAAAAVTNGSQ